MITRDLSVYNNLIVSFSDNFFLLKNELILFIKWRFVGNHMIGDEEKENKIGID